MMESPEFTIDFFVIILLAAGLVLVIAVICAGALWLKSSPRGAMAVAVTVAAVATAALIFQIRVRRQDEVLHLEMGQQAAMQAELRRAEMERRAVALADQLASRQARPDVDGARTDEKAAASFPDSTERISPAWLPELEEKFEASVHLSVEHAGRALLRQGFQHLDRLLPAGTELPGVILLISEGTTPDIDVLAVMDAMKDDIVRRNPGMRVVFDRRDGDSRAAEPAGDELHIRLRVTRTVVRHPGSNSSTELPGPDVSGTLRAEFAGEAGAMSFSTEFDQTLWLAATDRFLSQNHKSPFLVARCRQLGVSADEASEDALHVAADLLADLVRRGESPEDVSVRNVLLQRLRSGEYIVDRFVQRLNRPYADVYRAAVLVDAGRSNLRDMMNAVVEEAARHEQSRRVRTVTKVSQTLGAILVAVSLTALYLLLNWLTKGYYRTQLTVLFCALGGGLAAAVAAVGGWLA